MKVLATLVIVCASLLTQEGAVKPAPPTPAIAHGSGDRIDCLSDDARIVIATNYTLNLEPGVFAKKTNDALLLSTYDGAKLRVVAGNARIKVSSPTVARFTAEGWDLGLGRLYTASELRVSRDEQDDTDQNLKSMQEAAKKLKSKNAPTQDNQTAQRKLRTRWLFQENPTPTAELFNTAAIQQLTHLSNIGF